MIKKNNPVNIITLIPLICFGLIVVGFSLNSVVFNTNSNEMLQAIYNIVSTFAFAGSILGIPIGIVGIKKYGAHPVCIFDIIVGIFILLALIVEIIFIMFIVKLAIDSAPGILEFFNGLSSIG